MKRVINITIPSDFMKKTIYSGNKGADHNLYIMRGLPGSGKSTCANELCGTIFSTDDFFIEDGRYEFDPTKVGEAHEWNQRRTDEALRTGKHQVVVDNTNTRAYEIRPYAESAMDCGYSIILVEPDTPHKWDVEKLLELNSHNVPREMIEKMLKQYEHDFTLDQILQAESPFAQKN